jgi:hypothetical protein
LTDIFSQIKLVTHLPLARLTATIATIKAKIAVLIANITTIKANIATIKAASVATILQN